VATIAAYDSHWRLSLSRSLERSLLNVLCETRGRALPLELYSALDLGLDLLLDPNICERRIRKERDKEPIPGHHEDDHLRTSSIMHSCEGGDNEILHTCSGIHSSMMWLASLEIFGRD